MKATIIKRNGKCFVQLPSDFMETEEIELFRLRDGYFLISTPLEQKAGPKEETKSVEKSTGKTDLIESEKELLKKLMGIKFENRTPKHVSQFFSAEERKLLDQLEERGIVNLFTTGKYKDKGGVYNIPDDIYPKIRDDQTVGATRPVKPTASVSAASATGSSPLDVVFKTGYTVLQNQNEAYMLSDLLRRSNKNQDVIGIKGFDGKYYVVSKKYFAEMSYTIKNTLKEDMPLTALAQICKTDETGCRAVLQLMAESGEVVEKRKGIFAPA